MANLKPINSGDINSYGLSRLNRRTTLLFEISCGQRDTVRQSFDINYGSNVARSFDLTYSLIGSIAEKMEVSFPYEIEPTSPVRQEWELPYTTNIRNGAVISYNMNSPLADKMIVDMDYDLSTNNAVRNGYRLLHDIESASSTNATIDTPTVTFVNSNGATVSLDVIDASISMSEGDPYWTCTLNITDLDSFSEFVKDSEFTVTIGTDVFNFVTESRRQTRNGTAGQRLTVKGVSPTIKFDTPRADTISIRQSTTSVRLSNLVRQIVDTVDPTYEIDFRLPEGDIPAYTIGFSGVSPLEALQSLAESLGGVVESSKTGTIIMRPAYEFYMDHRIADLGDTAETFTFSQVFSATDLEEVQDTFNAVRVKTKDDKISDIIEVEEIPGSKQRFHLNIWPSVDRDTMYLRHNSAGVTIDPVTSSATRLLQETVEVIDGVASLSKPIDEILCVTWRDLQLHAPEFEPNGTDVFIRWPSGLSQDPDVVDQAQYDSVLVKEKAGFVGLVTITYATRFLRATVYSQQLGQVQFALEDFSIEGEDEDGGVIS